MKNKLLFIAIFMLNLVFGQEMYKINYSLTDNNNFACESYLFTNNNEAVFKINDNRVSGEITTSSGSVDFITNDELSRFFYTNKSLSYYRFLTPKGEILYSDDFNTKLNWTIKNEQKKIGKYNCFEAKTKINGRSFTAWFTNEFPIKFGPLKMHNLPGMVIQISEDEGFIKIDFVSIQKTKDLKIFDDLKKYILTSKPLTYANYDRTIVDLETGRRNKGLAKVRENNWEGVKFSDEIVKNYYLDIPLNLMSELKKLH